LKRKFDSERGSFIIDELIVHTKVARLVVNYNCFDNLVQVTCDSEMQPGIDLRFYLMRNFMHTLKGRYSTSGL